MASSSPLSRVIDAKKSPHGERLRLPCGIFWKGYYDFILLWSSRKWKNYFLVADAYKQSKLIDKGKSKYKYIVSNVHLKLPHCYVIDFNDIGKYNFTDCLILIDEASIYCDNRDWKNFGKDKIAYAMLHRHYNVDMAFYSQSYNGYDSKLRSITSHVYYVTRGLLLPISKAVRIPYGIIIPDKKIMQAQNMVK